MIARYGGLAVARPAPAGRVPAPHAGVRYPPIPSPIRQNVPSGGRVPTTRAAPGRTVRALTSDSHHRRQQFPVGATPTGEPLRPGDEVVVVESVFVGRGSLRTLEAGDTALVRVVDDETCVVLSLGMYVHLPRRAIRLPPAA